MREPEAVGEPWRASIWLHHQGKCQYSTSLGKDADLFATVYYYQSASYYPICATGLSGTVGELSWWLGGLNLTEKQQRGIPTAV